MCSYCLPKKPQAIQASHQGSREPKSRRRETVITSTFQNNGLDPLQLESLQRLPNLDKALLSTQALPQTTLSDGRQGSTRPTGGKATSQLHASVNGPKAEDEPNAFKSNLTITKPDKSDTKTYSNLDVLANLNTRVQVPQCTCLFSMQSYQATRLGLTYLCYIRFPDGTNSLLKAENYWNIEPESPVSLSLHLKSPKVKLNESLGLVLVVRNSLTQEIDLQVSENSFRFNYSVADKNFGSLVLENKIARSLYVGPMSQDSISFFFMPIKCGLVELERVVLFDQKTRRDFVFECHYKILIH